MSGEREKTTYFVQGNGLPKFSELSDEERKHYQKTIPTIKPLRTSVEEMDKNNVPLYLRDRCVHRVIPLNNCRHENLYAPWACEEERLRYERCQFKQFLKTVRKSQRLWKKEEKLRLIQQKINEAKTKDPSFNVAGGSAFDEEDDE